MDHSRQQCAMHERARRHVAGYAPSPAGQARGAGPELPAPHDVSAPLPWRRSFFRAFLAYAIALQAILTVWGGAFTPANAADDVFSVICRSVGAAQGQDQTDPLKRSSDHGLACHCTAACAAGGGCCGTGAAGLAAVLPVPEGRMIALMRPDVALGAMHDSLSMLHRARAPPVET